MKKIIQHETYGEIIFEESMWTGRKSLTINGVPLTKVSKKEFQMQDGTTVTLLGNFLQGCVLAVGGENIRLTPKIKWYEIVLAIIPFVLILIWGNVVALCEIVPVVGGLIGGAISGAFSAVGLYFIKKADKWWLKILIALAAVGVTFGVCCAIGYAIVGALT